VQVEFDKDDKGFVKEALERYPNLANMRKWVHWFFTKSARYNIYVSVYWMGLAFTLIYMYD
jgi:hypothetical protein